MAPSDAYASGPRGLPRGYLECSRKETNDNRYHVNQGVPEDYHPMPRCALRLETEACYPLPRILGNRTDPRSRHRRPAGSSGAALCAPRQQEARTGRASHIARYVNQNARSCRPSTRVFVRTIITPRPHGRNELFQPRPEKIYSGCVEVTERDSIIHPSKYNRTSGSHERSKGD